MDNQKVDLSGFSDEFLKKIKICNKPAFYLEDGEERCVQSKMLAANRHFENFEKCILETEEYHFGILSPVDIAGYRMKLGENWKEMWAEQNQIYVVIYNNKERLNSVNSNGTENHEDIALYRYAPMLKKDWDRIKEEDLINE